MKKSLAAVPAALCLAVVLTGCSNSNTEPEPTPIDAATRMVLVNDANELSKNLRTYQAEQGVYPQVSADDVLATTQTILTAPLVVEAYEATPDTAWFCLTNPVTDGWVSVDVNTNILRTEGKTCQK